MRVFIDDGLSLQKKELTGIGWHTKTLIENLKKLGINTEIFEYPSFFLKLSSYMKRLFYMSYFAKRNIYREDIDIIHYTNFFVYPKTHKKPVIATIHDLTVFKCPNTLPISYRYYGKLSIRNAINFSDLIIVHSYSVKHEILENFSGRELLIEVIFDEVRESLFNVDLSKNENIVDKPYILFVGTLEKRKNIFHLAEIFYRFIEKAKLKDCYLIIVGKKGYGFTKKFEEFIDSSKNIVWLRYVDDKTLKKLYSNARAFIYPSIYEGFGKPLVEAMLYQLPIIANNIPTTIELNLRHGKKFYIYNNYKKLVEILEFIFKEDRKYIKYPNLEIYHPINIAKKHIEIYKKIAR